MEELHSTLRRAGIAPAQISYQTGSVPDLPLSEMQISFGFRSDYAKFKRLLQLFENNRRWIIVRDATLARDPENPASVDVRLVLATYFSGEEGRRGAGAAREGRGMKGTGKVGTKRQAILLAALGLVLVFAVVRWRSKDRPAERPAGTTAGLSAEGDEPRRGGRPRAREISPDEVPLISPDDLDPRPRGVRGGVRPRPLRFPGADGAAPPDADPPAAAAARARGSAVHRPAAAAAAAPDSRAARHRASSSSGASARANVRSRSS